MFSIIFKVKYPLRPIHGFVLYVGIYGNIVFDIIIIGWHLIFKNVYLFYSTVCVESFVSLRKLIDSE